MCAFARDGNSCPLPGVQRRSLLFADKSSRVGERALDVPSFTHILIGAAVIGLIVLIASVCGGDDSGSSSSSGRSVTQSECIRYLGNQNLSAASRGNCRQVLGGEYCSYVRGAIGYRIEVGKDVDRLVNLRNLHC